MADVAVWSGATGSGDGSSWANAYTTLQAAIAATNSALQPTRIFIASDHSELVSTNIAFPGGQQITYTLISCDRTSGYPPTVEQAGARIGSTDATNLVLQNSFCSKGVFWTAGENSTATRNFSFDSSSTSASVSRIIGGGIELRNTGSGSRFILGTGATARCHRIQLDGVEVRFGNAGQGLQQQNALLNISGGSIAGSAITSLVKSATLGFLNIDVRGMDMSACASSFVVNDVASMTGKIKFDRCKMPPSWTGGMGTNTTVSNGLEAIMTNCDNADTNYRVLGAGYASTFRNDTAVYRTGGASDGVTPLSWRIATDTTSYPLNVGCLPGIEIWNETVGSPVTLTVEVLTDGLTLNDDDAWVEVSYLGNGSFPVGSVASDEKTSMLASGAAQASSSAGWTTTGITSPVKQKLHVTITPQEKGWLVAQVKVARGSTTMYVCPKVEIS